MTGPKHRPACLHEYALKLAQVASEMTRRGIVQLCVRMQCFKEGGPIGGRRRVEGQRLAAERMRDGEVFRMKRLPIQRFERRLG